MNNPENGQGKPLWSEPEVAVLLEDFFRQELPTPLRQHPPQGQPRELPFGQRARAAGETISPPSPRRASTATIQTRRTPAGSMAGVLAVGLCALLLVTAALITWETPANPARPDAQRNGASSRLAQPSSSPRTKDDSLRKFDSLGEEEGPVELKPNLHHVGNQDGRSESGHDGDYPELDIEVFPLDKELPTGHRPATAKPRPRPNQPAPPVPADPPRELPESRPPADPDAPEDGERGSSAA